MSKNEGTEEASQEKPVNENTPKDSNADIYENRGTPKIVRLITVMAYMFSVSFVAIVLSAYYLFLWEPPNPRLLRRPSHLIGGPEYQYLMNDPTNDYTLNFHKNVTFEQENFDSIKFTGRGVDASLNVTDEQETRNRSKLDDCFDLLRNSLMEFLRNRMNNSKTDRYPVGKNFRTLGSAAYASLENERGSNMAENSSEEGAGFGAGSRNVVESDKWILFAKIRNQNRDVSPTRDAGIVPGETNDSIDHVARGSYRDAVRSTENPRKWNFLYEENDRDVSENLRVTVPENDGRIPTEIVENDRRRNIESDGNTNSFHGGFRALVRSATIINKSDVIMTTGDKEDPVTQRVKGNVNKAGVLVNDRSIVNSSRLLEFTDRLKSNRSSTMFANDAMNIRETQIEKITTKLVYPRNDQIQKPDIVTTPETTPQKDLLTILTATTETSSSVSPVTIPKDYPTDSSTTSNRETFTKRRPENAS
ncbi:uncharacterized protein LOC143145181 [Ptiloglossa arizonensis]|uniref:uncharacterized protein LOC143145181 n=1 Tax=Ptiloglossa arizonensis TaxID=3350558 RepID=UPI003FA0708A